MWATNLAIRPAAIGARSSRSRSSARPITRSPSIPALSETSGSGRYVKAQKRFGHPGWPSISSSGSTARLAIAMPTRLPIKVGCSARCLAKANIVFAVRMASSKCPRAISARNRTWKRPRQPTHLLDLGEQQVEPVDLQLLEHLPVGFVHPRRTVGLDQHRAAVVLHLADRQLLERHRQQPLAAFEGLLVEQETLLFHAALHVVIDWVPGRHFVEFRQQHVAKGRPREPPPAGNPAGSGSPEVLPCRRIERGGRDDGRDDEEDEGPWHAVCPGKDFRRLEPRGSGLFSFRRQM